MAVGLAIPTIELVGFEIHQLEIVGGFYLLSLLKISVMQAYKLIATINNDGKIVLPEFLKRLYNKTVEIILLEKSHKTNKSNGLKIPTYTCGGKVSDFNREDLYDSRL